MGEKFKPLGGLLIKICRNRYQIFTSIWSQEVGRLYFLVKIFICQIYDVIKAQINDLVTMMC